ncbi:Snf7-domain-containing protein [Gonapodya prolifera JEL478]|uniref:Vacuolar-sorting protein SNF7 n=1 Tax=Gonapodya prolifera (strain JEL478) TaxID=1344416 RepID=A0A139AXS5_GONPJ|nr:Snf7-domain-containing protein [Gonapodya prolifera JEL478]|eukprot:KXS21519.1 Snf7-domain-containing protein [Gonapodya prolifera JEL478]
MNLFGRRKEPKVNPKEAMNKLRETSDMLEKREKYLESKIDAELKFAKMNASKNKRAALMALKRKKTWENEVLKLGNTRATIEAQLNAIEGVNINLEVMNAMKAGGQAMKTIHGDLNIDKVDNIMDDVREQMDLANEVWDAISQPQFGTEHDEDELAQELDALEQEALDEQFTAVPSVALPGVPTGVPDIAQPPRPARVQAEEEDEELNQLKLQMAI